MQSYISTLSSICSIMARARPCKKNSSRQACGKLAASLQQAKCSPLQIETSSQAYLTASSPLHHHSLAIPLPFPHHSLTTPSRLPYHSMLAVPLPLPHHSLIFHFLYMAVSHEMFFFFPINCMISIFKF